MMTLNGVSLADVQTVYGGPEGASMTCRPPTACGTVPLSTPGSAAHPTRPADSPLAWFADMVSHAHAYAVEAHAAGRPVVGIMCEYTPRELILAAGGVPVCLCGGDAEMIPAAEEASRQTVW